MPARHDLLVGALDFLWRPWGSIEIWEDAITYDLQRAGVTTMLVSDHPHLFEIGGENYHTDFTAWHYERGHESDPWRTRPDPTWTGTPALPAEPGFVHHAYDDSRTWFRAEERLPRAAHDASGRAVAADERASTTIASCCSSTSSIRTNRSTRPSRGRRGTTPEWDGPRLIWPPYSTETIAKGRLQPDEARQIRANYQSKLAMIDHWLGRILDALDDARVCGTTPRSSSAPTTATTSASAMRSASPASPCSRDLGHTPLLIAWPGVAPRHGRRAHDQRRSARDLRRRVRRRARAPHARPFARAADPRRDRRRCATTRCSATGARHVHVVDTERHYARAPVGENFPLAMWSNRWSTMPIHARPELRLPRPDRRAELAYMPGSDVPVIRQPFACGRLPAVLGLRRRDRPSPAARSRRRSVADREPRRHRRPRRKRSTCCAPRSTSIEAPTEQYERLGLAVDRTRLGSREEQVDVAELVPEVALVVRPRRTRRRARAGRRPLPASAGVTLRARASR